MPHVGVYVAVSLEHMYRNMPVWALGLGYGADGEGYGADGEVQDKRKNSVQYCILDIVCVCTI